jgi:hypothetical protein
LTSVFRAKKWWWVVKNEKAVKGGKVNCFALDKIFI